MVTEDQVNEMVNVAIAARSNAYAPYSKYKVGAAVLAASGRIYAGANVENASYGLTNCAERTAIFQAVSQGERTLMALAVVADSTPPVPPCGACLQVMAEFGIKLVIMANPQGAKIIRDFAAIFPVAFSGEVLPGGEQAG